MPSITVPLVAAALAMPLVAALAVPLVAAALAMPLVALALAVPVSPRALASAAGRGGGGIGSREKQNADETGAYRRANSANAAHVPAHLAHFSSPLIPIARHLAGRNRSSELDRNPAHIALI